MSAYSPANPFPVLRALASDEGAVQFEAVTTRYLDRPGGRVAYDDEGDGPLVLMLPGLGDLRQQFRFLRKSMLEAGYRVVTMDLRGHGATTTGWDDYTCTALGADALALVDALGAGPAILIGNSMGGGAAAWAAAEAPNKIASLVLLDPFVRADLPQTGLSLLLMKAVMALAFNGPWKVWAWTKYYDSLYPSRKPDDHAAYIASLAANLRESRRFEAVKAMMSASKADVEPRLPKITAPTLVVMGTKDPDFPDPEAEARLVTQLIGHGSVAMVDGAGHYPHAEFPSETADLVLQHIAQAN